MGRISFGRMAAHVSNIFIRKPTCVVRPFIRLDDGTFPKSNTITADDIAAAAEEGGKLAIKVVRLTPTSSSLHLIISFDDDEGVDSTPATSPQPPPSESEDNEESSDSSPATSPQPPPSESEDDEESSDSSRATSPQPPAEGSSFHPAVMREAVNFPTTSYHVPAPAAASTSDVIVIDDDDEEDDVEPSDVARTRKRPRTPDDDDEWDPLWYRWKPDDFLEDLFL